MSTEQSNALQHIFDMPLDEVLSEKYLSYALSTIMARSLPDVRDGLKPVHRRLMFAMRQLNLRASGMPKKSARVVGDVIGKYHPHGDTAVYDAMVRLAQDFAVRYPLVYGQGNFGNIDGDGAAAMRYTEAKLTPVAEALLEDLDQDTVDFRFTYDEESKEPIVLPAAFPNLLANGAMGIAVGMATSIPPHNVGEICDALIKLINKKTATVAELMEFIKAPDLPTGGIIVEKPEAMLHAYETGKGSFRVRSKWHTEDLGKGAYQIVVTEIPYQVQKSGLIEKIANLLHEKKLPLLEDVQDESAEDVRVVFTPRSRNVQPEILMETLFRACDLESRISLNMNVLDGGVTPRVMNLKQVLQAFLNHRHEVLVRKSNYRLEKIEARLEILEGLLVAYLNLDEVIRIIRYEDEPKAELIKTFKLTDNQAEAILNMKLRNLRKLEEMEIQAERDKLLNEKAGLQELLDSEDLRWKTIRDQIKETKKQFADDRRTALREAPLVEEVPLEAMIEKEPLTILISEQGWVRALKGTITDVSDQKYKDGDREKFIIRADTTDKLLILSTNGRFYTVGCDGLPRGRGFGEPLRIMIGLPAEDDFTAILKYEKGRKLLLAADDGRGFVVPQDEVVASTKNGKQVMSVPKGAEASICRVIEDGHDHVASIGMNRKLLIFPLAEVPELQKGRGVILQRYKDGGLSDVITFKLEDGLSWLLTNGNTRNETNLAEWIGRRAGAGRMPPHGFPRTNKF